MNIRTDIEILGLALIIGVDPANFFIQSVTNSEDFSKSNQDLWSNMFTKAKTKIPKDISNLRFTAFRHADHSIISISLPSPQEVDQSYYACCIIGPHSIPEGTSTEEMVDIMNSSGSWRLFTLARDVVGCKLLYFEQGDEQNNPHFEAKLALPPLTEHDFISFICKEITGTPLENNPITKTQITSSKWWEFWKK